MVSRLEAIFRTGFHPVEKTDVWQGIRREDPADGQKRKEHDGTEKPEEAVTDDTVLSLLSLHGFLTMLLRQAGAPGADNTVVAPLPASAVPPAPSVPHPASRAASAYQTTARTGEPLSLEESPTPQPVPGPAVVLSPEELRRIHALLQDVETLAAQGIATITLRPAADFLQSLNDAVQAALRGE